MGPFFITLAVCETCTDLTPQISSDIMVTMEALSQETVWFEKWRCDDAESAYQMQRAGTKAAPAAAAAQSNVASSSLVNEIVKAREQIQKSLQSNESTASSDPALNSRVATLESENNELKKVTCELRAMLQKLEARICSLEGSNKSAPAPADSGKEKAAVEEEEADDDDFELFGDDEEEEAAAAKLKEERIKAYTEKKSQKKQIIAKSNVILDIKPWDDETDMAELEKCVRSIVMDGLLWGTGKLVAVGYGIKKLTIATVVEDDKVSVEELEEKITEFEDYVQSVDIAAFNKI